MRKLIQGIVAFRQNLQPEYRERFARLALGQAPDALLIACSDSRVVPNLFASADPGDLFVTRNVGNLVPPAASEQGPSGGPSEAAAIEFALANLPVTDIIVCGHSECGAMHALLRGRDRVESPNLRSWLRHGEGSLERLGKDGVLDPTLAPHNRLSQCNVLVQMENVKTYPSVSNRMAAGQLRVHGWWFELKQADVYAYEESVSRFVLIDEAEAASLLQRLE